MHRTSLKYLIWPIYKASLKTAEAQLSPRSAQQTVNSVVGGAAAASEVSARGSVAAQRARTLCQGGP